MRHPFTLIISSFVLIFSCAESDDANYKQLVFNYNATEVLKWEMRYENDSLIKHLSTYSLNGELKIRDVRNESLRKIQDLEDSLIRLCGGWNMENGELINPLEQELVVKYWIDSPNGIELKESINLIVGFISKYDTTVLKLARDPKEFKEFVNHPTLSQKTFIEVNFENANLIGVLNTLRIYQLFILQSENKFLNSLIVRDK